jgi:hypothetical protein
MGLRCPRLLWWQVHDPDAAELVAPPDVRARYAWGQRVGRAAWDAFPDGIAIPLDPRHLDDAVAATEAAVRGGATRIYEASFLHRDVFVAVDILDRDSDGWTLREVKSSTGVRDQHLPDAAIQAWVLAERGLPIDRVEVVHLNRECVYPDLTDLFEGEDVSEVVGSLLPDVPGDVDRLASVLAGPLPAAEIGERCHTPYTCPFRARCWPELPLDHVSTLYYGGRRKRELLAAGIERIGDIPTDVALNEIQDRQRRALRAGDVIVDEGLADAMADYEEPIAYLDFETVALPIPAWEGCRPYDAVPVQYACATRETDATLRLREYLGDGGGDPRPALTAALIEALDGAGTILAYNASFEQRCVEQLMEVASAEEAAALEQIWDKLEDLLPVVKDHVYAPAFRGSFSLKRVLPALVPEMAYDDLAVAGGAVASTELTTLLLEPDSLPPAEREQLRADLLAYCRRDVEGLAALHRWLEARAT